MGTIIVCHKKTTDQFYAVQKVRKGIAAFVYHAVAEFLKCHDNEKMKI